MTILEGEQGDLKSTVWNTLAGNAWFSDSLPDLHDKDAAQALCGKWFVEFAELAHFQRSEIETVKRFLSAKADHYRPSYGKKAATFARQNIFVGSTNEEHYFKDHTGNRRFWPVQVQGICDIAALEHDRDQLWAEAVVRYRQQERWYLSAALEALARNEQAQRAELDDWEPGVMAYSEDNCHLSSDQAWYYITTEELLRDHFHLDNPLHHTQANTKRLGGILRRNGWKSRQVRSEPGGKQFWAFVQKGPSQDPDPVMPPTHHSGETHHSEYASKEAPCTPVMAVIGIAHTQESLRLSAFLETAITRNTPTTPITAPPDSEATTGSPPPSPPPSDHSPEDGPLDFRPRLEDSTRAVPEIAPPVCTRSHPQAFCEGEPVGLGGRRDLETEGEQAPASAPAMGLGADRLATCPRGGTHNRMKMGKEWRCSQCNILMTPPL